MICVPKYESACFYLVPAVAGSVPAVADEVPAVVDAVPAVVPAAGPAAVPAVLYLRNKQP
jgi:hypothetical protein